MKRILLAGLAMSGLVMASGHGGESGGGSGDSVKLDSFVINLKGGGSFLRCVPNLKLTDPKEQDLLKAYTPVVRHEIIKALIGLPPEKVSTPQFMDAFSESLTETLNRVLDAEVIKAVYFSDWIVQ